MGFVFLGLERVSCHRCFFYCLRFHRVSSRVFGVFFWEGREERRREVICFFCFV